MATFVFDGTSNITAAKTDTVVITAPVTSFTSVADVGGNSSVFNFGGRTLTITGTTFGANGTNFPGVSVAGGFFSTGAASPVTGGLNDLVIGSTGTVDATAAVGTTASSVHALFGGLGVADPVDGADTFTLGGKGSYLVYGNAGADTIIQGVNNVAVPGGASGVNQSFDSTSFETIFGGKGNDSITLTGGTAGTAAATANVGAKMAIYGGEGSDTIIIQNGGTGAVTTIFGGQGAADPTDSADVITFNGGGTVNIFGNAGADTISLGASGGLANGTVAVVHGGRDADGINIVSAAGTKSTISVFGDENTNSLNAGDRDSISVTGNGGTTVIYGGTAAADANDGADLITFAGQGQTTIYAAGGNDVINLNGNGGATADSTSIISAFGGNGDDSVNVLGLATVNGLVNLTGGAGADVYNFGSAVVPATTESATISFNSLAAGESVTVNGLTLTVATGQSLTAAKVANLFDNLVAGSTATQAATGAETAETFAGGDIGVTGGVTGTVANFSGTFNTGSFTTANATNASTSVVASATATGNVQNIAVSGNGVSAVTVDGAAAGGSTAGTGQTSTITDFTVGTGGDKLNIATGFSVTSKFIVDGSQANTLQSALNLAVQANGGTQGTVAVVAFQGNTYVVAHEGSTSATATFTDGTDLAIKLTGITDVAGVSTAVTVI